jgi:hypothetical protein
MAWPFREGQWSAPRKKPATGWQRARGWFTLYILGMFILGWAVHAHFFTPRARAAARPLAKASAPIGATAQPAAPAHTWTTGSREEEVKRLQGIPRSVDPYPSLGPHAVRWSYWHWDSAENKQRYPTAPTFIDEIFFQDGRVIGYHNASGLLKVK